MCKNIFKIQNNSKFKMKFYRYLRNINWYNLFASGQKQEKIFTKGDIHLVFLFHISKTQYWFHLSKAEKKHSFYLKLYHDWKKSLASVTNEMSSCGGPSLPRREYWRWMALAATGIGARKRLFLIYHR